MALTVIIGPMKSGKSLELIARTAPYEFAEEKVIYVQPARNVRDEGIASRIGIETKAHKVTSLSDIKPAFDVIALDEFHMFDPRDIKYLKDWLKNGKEVVVSGLDLDYRGKLIPVMAALLELKPEQIIIKQAVCDVCHKYRAQFTQIIHEQKPVIKGLPAVVPEDGTYAYQARCRQCFIQA